MKRPASLTSRLVLTAVGLVVVVAVLIGFVATAALHAQLTSQLDDDLRSISGVRGPIGDGPGPGTVPPGGSAQFDRRGGPETLTAIFDGSTQVGGVVTGRDESEDLSDAVFDQLDDVPVDGDVHEVDLTGLGEYRVIAVKRTFGTEVTGLPTEPVDESIHSLLLAESVLIGLGALVAAGGGLLLVRRQLRPLNEVAATAHRVAELPCPRATSTCRSASLPISPTSAPRSARSGPR